MERVERVEGLLLRMAEHMSIKIHNKVGGDGSNHLHSPDKAATKIQAQRRGQLGRRASTKAKASKLERRVRLGVKAALSISHRRDPPPSASQATPASAPAIPASSIAVLHREASSGYVPYAKALPDTKRWSSSGYVPYAKERPSSLPSEPAATSMNETSLGTGYMATLSAGVISRAHLGPLRGLGTRKPANGPEGP
jgi:hypothetical protein